MAKRVGGAPKPSASSTGSSDEELDFITISSQRRELPALTRNAATAVLNPATVQTPDEQLDFVTVTAQKRLPVSVTTRSGDTLTGIAAKDLGKGATQAQILVRAQQYMQVNGISDPQKMQVGVKLTVPAIDQNVSKVTQQNYAASDAKVQGERAAQAQTAQGAGSIDFMAANAQAVANEHRFGGGAATMIDAGSSSVGFGERLWNGIGHTASDIWDGAAHHPVDGLIGLAKAIPNTVTSTVELLAKGFMAQGALEASNALGLSPAATMANFRASQDSVANAFDPFMVRYNGSAQQGGAALLDLAGLVAGGAGLARSGLRGVGSIGGAARGVGIGNSGYRTVGQFTDAVTTKYQALYDQGYALAQQNAGQGLIASSGRAIGSDADAFARVGLRNWLKNVEGIQEGTGQIIQVNRRLYDPAGTGAYRVPDVYIPGSRTILDGSISFKSATSPQIIDFGAFSSGARTTIIAPSGLPWGSYSIVP